MATPFVITFVIVAAIAAFYIIDAKISDRTVVYGQVDGWAASRNEAHFRTYIIDVALADGSKVVATADIAGRAPRVGERIEVAKMRTGTGRIRYEWAR